MSNFIHARDGVPFFKTGYNHDTDVESLRTGLECKDVTRAVQSGVEETDINEIVRRFGVTGMLPQNVRQPLDEDFSEVFDFRTAMDAINAANRSFAAMSADVRARFGNDPARFVDFCNATNDKGELINLPEMVKLGLAVKRPDVVEPKPVKVEVINAVGK